ncbi:MAG: F0F1 ATP synthase subunit delta [Caulobacteraceae bacterium]
MADNNQASDVGARYARALLDLAAETDVLEAVDADLTALKSMLKASADLRALLASPRFDHEAKGAGLAAIAERAGFNDTTRKFLGLLAANRRASALLAVIEAFERQLAARRGLVAARVTTAAPLTKAQAASLAAGLAQVLGREPQIETVVDPAILGGLKVRVGSRLYDASLKTRLDSLKFALKRA